MLLKRLQSAVSRNSPRFWPSLLWVVLLVAIPTIIRFLLSPLVGTTMWFATYYPAILVAGLLLGVRTGAFVLAGSALAATLLFMPTHGLLALSARDLTGILIFLIAAGLILGASGLLREALLRLQAANDREKLLNDELRHRMKNMLTVVQGIAFQTSRLGDGNADGPAPSFYQAFEGRLEALGRAHDLLSGDGLWQTFELERLAARALEPFQISGRIHIAGPRATLPADCCIPLVLILHELATNALKYGALSSPEGTVKLVWQREDRPLADEPDLLLRWEECDGPRVSRPVRRGLGTRLIVRQSGLDAVDLRFEPDGVVCEIRLRSVGAPPAMQATSPASVAPPNGTFA